MGWAALAMFAVFLLAMLDSILPTRLGDPTWQLAMVAALVDNAVVPLVGLIVLHVGARINPRDGFSAGLRDGAARLAVLVALGFLLLAPLQAWNGWRLQHRQLGAQQTQLRQAEDRFQLLRQAVELARTPEELQERLRQLVGQGLPPLDRSRPLPQLRQELRRILARNETLVRQQLQRQSRGGSAAGREGLLGAPLRGSLACLAYAVAFAALARRDRRTVSLLGELLLALPWLPPPGGTTAPLSGPVTGGAGQPQPDPPPPPDASSPQPAPGPMPQTRSANTATPPEAPGADVRTGSDQRPDAGPSDRQGQDPHHDDPYRYLVP